MSGLLEQQHGAGFPHDESCLICANHREATREVVRKIVEQLSAATGVKLPAPDPFEELRRLIAAIAAAPARRL